MTPLLSFSDIHKRYETEAGTCSILEGVSGSIHRGEWIGVSGPSGSGKSTLLHIVGAVDAPSKGDVQIEGSPIPFKDISACDRIRRSQIGFVFQYFNLLQHLTAKENVMFPLLLNGIPARKAHDRAMEALGTVSLAHRADHFPHTLSGGEQQRIALLRATVHKPLLIVADEPTGNLDHKSRDIVLEHLKNLTQEGIAIIMASHSSAALDMCSKILVLSDGQFVS